jgi:hypothetical protein
MTDELASAFPEPMPTHRNSAEGCWNHSLKKGKDMDFKGI